MQHHCANSTAATPFAPTPYGSHHSSLEHQTCHYHLFSCLSLHRGRLLSAGCYCTGARTTSKQANTHFSVRRYSKVRGQDVSHECTAWQACHSHVTFCPCTKWCCPFQSHWHDGVHQVVVLRSLRSKLCEAIAEVHSTTSALHLRVTKHEDADGHAGQSSSAGENNHTEHLFQQARQAIVQTCNSCSKVSLIQTHQDLVGFFAICCSDVNRANTKMEPLSAEAHDSMTATEVKPA